MKDGTNASATKGTATHSKLSHNKAQVPISFNIIINLMCLVPLVDGVKDIQQKTLSVFDMSYYHHMSIYVYCNKLVISK